MRVQKVYFLKGLPACGKSTWAREKIEEDRMNGVVTKRVNKDELRAMMDNSVHSKERELFVNQIQNTIILESLKSGYNVIIDNTNFFPKHFETIKEIISSTELNSKNIDLEEIFFDVPVNECILRDSRREKRVGKKAIMDMYNKYLKGENVPSIDYNSNLPDCIIVDVDGTLAIRGNRSPYGYWRAKEDKLNTSVANLVHSLQKSNPNVSTIIMTGRENLCNEENYTIKHLTIKWLVENGIHFEEIYIRKENDHRPDYEVKSEMYEEFVKDVFNVLYIIDDRKQVIDMWREKGLMVLDVAGHDF